MRRFAGLDHLRALAIIIVFVYHYNMFGHPASTSVAFLGGWLLHLLVEKPFLRLRDKWLARKKASLLPAPIPTSPTGSRDAYPS